MENVSQVTGFNAGSVANTVISTARNARAHRQNCERLASHVRMIGNLLEKLKSTELAKLPAMKEPLDGLEEALRKANLVESCKDKSYLYMLAMGWSVVCQFRQVEAQIDRYLGLVPLISLVHDFRMQHFSEGSEAVEQDKREYTLDEEEMEAHKAILNINRSKKDAANILEKSLSRRYPDLGFHQALDEEKQKLHVELRRSRTNNNPEQSRAIENLIEVTKSVVNVTPSNKLN